MVLIMMSLLVTSLLWAIPPIPNKKDPKLVKPTPMEVTPSDLNTAPNPTPRNNSSSEAFPKTLQTKKAIEPIKDKNKSKDNR